MKTFLCLLFCASVTGLALAQDAKDPSDKQQIRATILDYIEGYYSGDASRVERALSPSLAKRAVGKTKDGKIKIHEETAEGFLKLTKSGDGPKSYPTSMRRAEIRVLDVYRNVASAKLIGADWMDYIHLSKQDGHWVIMNVLWTSYPPQKA